MIRVLKPLFCSSKLGWKLSPAVSEARSGVTLIELMVYMTILSIVTIGVMQMLIGIQKTNVDTINRADQFAASDLALRRVQVKLGNTDNVEVVDLKSGDRACLRLKTYKPRPRSGYYFNGHNQYIRTSGNRSDFFGLTGPASRTVSVWVKPDHDMTGDRTVLIWGRGVNRAFGIDLGEATGGSGSGGSGTGPLKWTPHVRLSSHSNLSAAKCPSLAVTGQPAVTHTEWHHIAVSYSNTNGGLINPQTTKVYIDGKPQTTEYRQCSTSGATPASIDTANDTLFIGRNRAHRETAFKGHISDVRIWNRALSPDEILALYQRTSEADANVGDLFAQLPLDRPTSDPIRDKGSWNVTSPGEFNHIDITQILRRGIADSVEDHFFCFIDDDGDRLFELWESESANKVPKEVGGTARQAREKDWTRQSDDIFVAAPSGFFQVVGRDPETVIANFAVGKGYAGSADLAEKTESRPLASTRSNKRPELCAIINNAIATPGSCANSFKAAFVAIDGYLQGHHGKLDIQHVTWSRTGEVYQASALPNIPTDIVATWYPKHGVMKFSSPTAKEDKYWDQAISQTLYRPIGRSSDASVTFNISLGRLAMFKNGKATYFDFKTSGSPLRFDDALVDAGSIQYCGLDGHLANISTKAEQEHLHATMMTGEFGSWQSGFIGGKVNSNYDFEWVTGTADEQKKFWQGDGKNGVPYDFYRHNTVSITAREFLEWDRAPDTQGNRRQNIVMPKLRNLTFWYTNWAAGKEAFSNSADMFTCDPAIGKVPVGKCEPVSSNPGDAVAIYGHKNRDGTWFSVPNGSYSCTPDSHHSICGFYIELNHATGKEPVSLGRQVTRDMGRFREFCQSADQTTG